MMIRFSMLVTFLFLSMSNRAIANDCLMYVSNITDEGFNNIVSVSGVIDNNVCGLKSGDAIKMDNQWGLTFSLASILEKEGNTFITITMRKKEDPKLELEKKIIDRSIIGNSVNISKVPLKIDYSLKNEDQELSRPIIMISGGLGITPNMSHLRHIHDKKSLNKQKILFISSVRNYNENIFSNELEYIQSMSQNKLNIVIHTTQEQGHLNMNIISNLIESYDIINESSMAPRIYICGSALFAKAIQDIVLDIPGVQQEFVHAMGNGISRTDLTKQN